MRAGPIVWTVAMAALPLCACAVPPFKGNDIGGIIAWSPETHRLRHELAAEHCAQWGKLHHITSVTPRYGDYIGFRCFRPRGSEGVVVRSAY